MSTQDNLTNAFIRHQVFVQRFGAKVGNDFISTMIDLQEAAEDRLLNSDLTDFQRERLELIARDLEAQFRASVSESAQERISELKQFGEYEAEFSQGLLETNISGSTTLPSPEQIGAAIDFANMKVGNTGLGIQQIFRGFTDNAAKQVAREITEGAVLGETNKQIADRLQRLNGLHKNQATTLTRTVTNNVSSIARDEVMRANEDVLDGYEWVAALDNRTTLVCASRDGQVYKFSDPEAPRPPAHFNCRSTIVPKVKPEFDLGADVKTTRPAIGDDGAELIDSDTTYEKWLRKQPAKFQDEVLGKDRGKLFRNKGIKLDRFVDANGNPIPLDQLKVLDESFNIKAKTKKIAETLPKEKVVRFTLKDKVVTKDSTVEDFEETIERLSSDRTKSVIYKTKRPSIVEKNGGVYYPLQELLESSPLRKDGSTLMHEYGHHIDHMIGDSIGKKFSGISASSDSFVNAFLKDRKSLGLHTRKTRFPKLNELAEYLANSEVKVYSNNFKETIRKVKSVYHGQITDIIDAMTEGAFHSYGVSGHGQKYYKFKDNRYNETFAQMFSLQGAPDEIKEIVKELFPETLRAFEEILDDYIKNGANTYDG